tara:strand:+ start:9 stop:536 length:528 start_codon:yes stop_codon:yes gene_type:complete
MQGWRPSSSIASNELIMAEEEKGVAREVIVVQNRKARYDYEVLARYETGIVLRGTEVKSLRGGQVNLKDSFATIERGEVFLHNVHISHYEGGNNFNHETERSRKLLLHRSEIRRLVGKTQQQGLTMVPLKIYFKGGKAKVELGLVRGKKQFDKRQTIARRQADRDVQRALKERHA